MIKYGDSILVYRNVDLDLMTSLTTATSGGEGLDDADKKYGGLCMSKNMKIQIHISGRSARAPRSVYDVTTGTCMFLLSAAR